MQGRGATMILLCDKDIASLVRMSPSWVRVQRHKRKTGKEHSLTVDAVMIGTTPRYRKDDIEVWLSSLPEGGDHA